MSEKNFVLMKWRDGWREVVEVDRRATGLNRYFVVERLEQFGRLSLSAPEGDYPGLLVIDRKPGELERVALLGSQDVSLADSTQYREGDRTEYHYGLSVDGVNMLDELMSEIREAATSRGMNLEDILNKPEVDRLTILTEIAAELRLVGTRSQDHVIELMESILAAVPHATA